MACAESDADPNSDSAAETGAVDDADDGGSETAAGEADTAADTAGAADSTGAGGEGVPSDPDALTAWLAADSYLAWEAESAPHASTGPHGRVLTYFNDTLAASFDAGNTEHPVGSASVKELLSATDEVTGFAVMVKTTAGTDAASWYWYLAMGDSVSAQGNGLGTCEGCHNVDSVDRVLTPYPLQ